MNKILCGIIIIVILVIIYMFLNTIYQESKPLPNSTANSMDMNVINKYNSRMKEMNTIKELFSSVPEPLNLDELDKLLQELGITNNQLNNMDMAINDYIDQIMQNNKIKDSDKKRVLDLLSQIYAIKLNDSLNSLNAVAVGEYLKMRKQNKIKFTPN